MSKRYMKLAVVGMGFIVAISYNACMVDGGALDDKKSSSSSSDDDIKENSGVSNWSTYPGGSTVHQTAGGTGGETGASTGTTSGATTGSTAGGTAGGTGAATGGGGHGGVTGGSGECSSGTSTTPANGTSTPPTCETNTGDWERLLQWLENSQSAGIPYCGIIKICKNCCGSETRYDIFIGVCACPTQMDASTLGATSNSMCEDEGMNYLAGFMEAKRAANIPCTTVKDCMNCCGPANNLDKFHISCER